MRRSRYSRLGRFHHRSSRRRRRRVDSGGSSSAGFERLEFGEHVRVVPIQFVVSIVRHGAPGRHRDMDREEEEEEEKEDQVKGEKSTFRFGFHCNFHA